MIAGCLVFYEPPLAFARHNSEARRHVMVIGAFVINALVFDLLGQLFNLWEVPIVGRLTYDSLVHATSMAFAICALIWAVAMRAEKADQLGRVRYLVPAFVAMGPLSVVHELIEFAIDLATNSNAGTSIVPGDLYDTHLDLAYLRHDTRRTSLA